MKMIYLIFIMFITGNIAWAKAVPPVKTKIDSTNTKLPGFPSPTGIRMGPDMMAGQDIHDAETFNAVGVIETHAVRRPPATVVTGDHEFPISQRFHDLDLIPRHRTK